MAAHKRAPRAIDLTGQHFGRLTVLRRAGINAANGNARWECQCECGNLAVVDGYGLRKGTTASCGCLRKELARARAGHDLLPYVDHEAKTLRNAEGIYYSSLVKSKRNRSGTVGVSFDQSQQVYVARLRFHGELVLNKSSHSKAEAIAYRREAERRYFPQKGDTGCMLPMDHDHKSSSKRRRS
ncbi:MAG: AP2 domain-containing protein [Lactobacillus sp.]|uniref:AP2 domain-containing protein n=1 Tax=Lacticaseibacillus suilingensis TaxID=2799577 RepID=A0ABW4BM20_9LACO|nr:AP2 domain-containing protein [Lacticaseibacillus suilingensis]MCI1895071.1 AP2 domain-containing protein [Lactobacillus sp.]MCI1917873.1 AP2 domain-containing protein [Lactobacillus sp.]MCI1942122.1 AP2 domain-containing protein [Lactobacillus sp.]MCI1972505.1 AP2 domain-containing protein [Lactobacillus sp.]MCI2017203.1 AP2 domain-containing protein [Lactobacillus sp.]